MMKVFQAWRLGTAKRHHDPETDQMTAWETSRSSLVIEQTGEDYIDESLGERFGFSAFFFLNNLTVDPATWAAIFFTNIIENSDEVLEARAELRDEIRFAAYGTAEVACVIPLLEPWL